MDFRRPQRNQQQIRQLEQKLTKEFNRMDSNKINNNKKKKKKRNNKSRNASNQLQSDRVYEAPIQITKAISNRPATINGKNNLEIVVSKREFVTTLTTTANLNIFQNLARIRLNPASEGFGKWISDIADAWEFYRFESIQFEYVPKCPSTTAGTILLAVDFDAADTVPVTEQSATACDIAREGSLWAPLIIDLPKDRLNALYKRRVTMDDTRFANSSQDEKTIDAGQLFVYSDNGTINTQVGKLWVKYTVRLMSPQPSIPPPTQQGGGQFGKPNGSVQNTLGNQPILSAATTGVTMNPEVLQSNTTLAYPTNYFGRFLQDYEGNLFNQLTGTGITTFPNLVVGATDGSTFLSNRITNLGTRVINTGATIAAQNVHVKAFAGEYLGLDNNGLATTITNVLNEFGSGVL